MIINEKTGEVVEIITKDKDGQLAVAPGVVQEMASMERQKKDLEKRFATYRDALRDAMAEYGVEKITTDEFTATYVGEHEQVRLDGKLVKEYYPRIYEECTKVVPVKASVKVRLK